MFAEHATPCHRHHHHHFLSIYFYRCPYLSIICFCFFSLLFALPFFNISSIGNWNRFPLSTSVVFIFVQLFIRSHISSFNVCHRNQKLKRINMPLFARHTHTTSTFFLHCSFYFCCFSCFVRVLFLMKLIKFQFVLYVLLTSIRFELQTEGEEKEEKVF